MSVFGSAASLLLAVLLLAASPARAVLVTYGFDGHLEYINCTPESTPGSCPPLELIGATRDEHGSFSAAIKARFTVDTDAIDLSPDPRVIEYAFNGHGTGLTIVLGGLTYATDQYQLFAADDQLGAWCGSGMRRDFVNIVSSIVKASFDTCNTAALRIDGAAYGGNPALFTGHPAAVGESLIVNGPYGPYGFQALGNTTALYFVAPVTPAVPEPATAALCIAGLFVFARRLAATQATR